MPRPWFNLGDGTYVRYVDPKTGTVEVVKRENVRRLTEENAARQRATKRNPRSVHRFGALQHVGRLSPTQWLQMMHETGGDPEKRRAWLRDHPETRTEAVGVLKAPKRRIVVLAPKRRAEAPHGKSGKKTKR